MKWEDVFLDAAEAAQDDKLKYPPGWTVAM
jgi:hypothetical protein